MPSPTPTCRPAPPSTILITRPRSAPKAIRTPISPVRRSTMYASTPNNPTAASTSPSTPKSVVRVAIILSCWKSALTTLLYGSTP